MLGIVEETPGNSYKKRQIDARSLDTINQYLSKLQESKEEATDKKMRVEDIPFEDISEEYHQQIREMLKKHEAMWLGGLGEINVTEHAIDLVPDARTFKSPPYRASPQGRKLGGTGNSERSEIDRASPVRMGSSGTLRPEEMRKAQVLCRLQKAQRNESQGFISPSKNRRLHRLPRRCSYLFNSRRKFWILANEDS